MTMGLLVVVFVLLLSSAAKSLDIRRRLNVHLPGVTPHSYEIGETVSTSRSHAHTFSTGEGGEEGHHQVHKHKSRISKDSNSPSALYFPNLPSIRSICR